jgi:hypothetical protein
VQEHTVQQLAAGPRAGTWVYSGGNDRGGRYIECCADAARRVMALPPGRRTASPDWQDIGHPTPEAAYAHMRTVLLDALALSGEMSGWSGCQAPNGDGEGVCNVPTLRYAELPGLVFHAPLCDAHRTRETVEAMWDGPGDRISSW